MPDLPRAITHVGIPPIKCQGIKTKLVPFISERIRWDAGDRGVWIEPFLGSGVVAFNLAPPRAVLADVNHHLIRFYRAIQVGEITPEIVRAHLEVQAPLLAAAGATHYYAVRQRFNAAGDPLDFLFLNRSCFNGLMRFNRDGGFNVPFGHKPERFSKGYITKIVNQIAWVQRQMHGKDWQFVVSDWRSIVAQARTHDLVYLDPPYVGRHADYFTQWTPEEAEALAEAARESSAGIALSMWRQNRYRRNTHLDEHWPGFTIHTTAHFYHVGATERLRNAMEEALLVSPGHSVEASCVPPPDRL